VLGLARVGTGFASPDRVEFRLPRPNEVSQSVSVRVDDVDRHFAHAKAVRRADTQSANRLPLRRAAVYR
jgi:hypothetical protein